MRQLSSLDAQFLAMESPSTYGHVGGLALFDPSTAPGGRLAAEDLCRVVSRRIDQLPVAGLFTDRSGGDLDP